MGYSGKGTTVAILDSGIDKTHPFFNGIEIQEIDLTGEGLQDDYKHGTNVSSILCAISPGVKLVSIKILDKEGSTTMERIMEGIQKAVDMDVDIINLSVGQEHFDCPDTHPLGQMVDRLTASNKVIICVAAGNNGPKRSPHVPASCLGAIAVGSCSKWGKTNIWSSKGGVCDDIYPDCVAYGDEIEGAMPDGKWDVVSGTSQATPQVSGMIALMREAVEVELTREMIELCLSQSCKRIESRDKNNKSGWGIINCGKFLRAIEINQENLW